MKRGAKGADPPKGQPSIRGFFTSKAAPPAPEIAGAAEQDHIAPAAEERPKAAVSLEEEEGATPEHDAGAPAPKRARAAPSPPSAAGPSAAAAAPRAAAPRAPAPPADPAARRARWHAKLLGDEPGLRGRGGARSQAAVDAAAERPPFTPLEEQVAALQAAHPDCLLCFEVGYKFRFFGRDAEVASACLGILAYPDRNFLAVSAGRLP
jgi:hypothetical protein